MNKVNYTNYDGEKIFESDKVSVIFSINPLQKDNKKNEMFLKNLELDLLEQAILKTINRKVLISILLSNYFNMSKINL